MDDKKTKINTSVYTGDSFNGLASLEKKSFNGYAKLLPENTVQETSNNESLSDTSTTQAEAQITPSNNKPEESQ